MIPPTLTHTDRSYIVQAHAAVWSPTRSFCAGVILVLLLAIPTCAVVLVDKAHTVLP